MFSIAYQRSELLSNGVQSEENGNGQNAPQNDKIVLSQLVANSSTPNFHEIYAMGGLVGSTPLRKTHKCCVYIANKSKYCARVNSIQAFSDINRDVSLYGRNSCSTHISSLKAVLYIATFDLLPQVVGDASHLSGYTFSAQNNIIHPSAVLGSKTTVSISGLAHLLA